MYLTILGTLYKWKHIIFIFFVTYFTSFHPCCGMCPSVICIYHILFIYSSVDGHFGYFHLLTIVDYVNMNMDVPVAVWVCTFNLSVHSEVGLLDQMVILCLPFLRSYCTVLNSGCIILHSYQQRTSVPTSPNPHCQHLIFSGVFYFVSSFGVFWIIAVLMGIKW